MSFSSISIPKPGSLEGVIFPFIGIGVPGILAVKGIPGSDPNQN